MKMIRTALLLFLAPILLHAQEIQGGFEQWDSVDDGMVSVKPRGWSFEASFGAGRESSAHSGSWGARIWNWYNEVPGKMILGDKSPSGWGNVTAGGGLPISSVPQRLTGVYKFVPGELEFGEDSALVAVLLKRYNPELGLPDTLSYVQMKLGPSDTWRPFELTIPAPVSKVMPDSIEIGFASSRNTFCRDGYCCYLSLDDIALVSAAGVPYQMESGRLVTAVVTPNPMREAAVITFDGEPGRHYTVDVVDESGCRAMAIEAIGNRAALRRVDLPAGTYMFVVRDAVGVTVARGRFVVE